MGNQANPQRALQGRYSCRAQGASPGLIVEIHLLSPARAALPHGKCSRRKCRSYGAQSTLVCVYPGLHFGLCPHYTLGFAGVSCLKALTSAPNNKRKSLGRKSLGFERKYRPTLKGFLVCIIVSVLDHVKVFTFIPLFHLNFNV